MNKCKLPDSEFEIVAAVGRRTAQRRKILTIAAYLPPKYSTEYKREFLAFLCDAILTLKNKYNDPYVIIAGDFNRRNLSEAIKDYPEIKPIKTSPTRGLEVLDIIATNMNEEGVTTPISAQDGTESDHKTVYSRFRMPRVPTYKMSEIHLYKVE